MSEDIPIDNLAWLSALHIGRYVKCKMTCSMKYDQKYSEFFSLLYLLFGSAVLNVLHGPAQFGTVVSKENSRSLYDPTMLKCNFTIPSVNHLQEVDYGYERHINSGLISKSVDMCKTDANKESVLFLMVCVFHKDPREK